MGNDKEVRLIDANALKESLKKLKAKAYNQKYQQGLQDAIDGYFPQIIDDAPTVDVQPVVHCKDCKYRKEHHYEDDGEPPYIKYSCKFTKYSMSDEGFCSFGVESDSDKDNNVRNLTDEETAVYESWIESEAKDTGVNIMVGDSE